MTRREVDRAYQRTRLDLIVAAGVGAALVLVIVRLAPPLLPVLIITGWLALLAVVWGLCCATARPAPPVPARDEWYGGSE